MALTSHVVHSDSDILGGTPVFTGTRVPVKTMLDYLEAGDSLEVFLDHFLKQDDCPHTQHLDDLPGSSEIGQGRWSVCAPKLGQEIAA